VQELIKTRRDEEELCSEMFEVWNGMAFDGYGLGLKFRIAGG